MPPIQLLQHISPSNFHSRSSPTCTLSGKDEADFYNDIEIIIRELLYRLNDESAKVLKANHQALGALTKHVPAEELVKNIDFVRNLIASMVSDARRRKGGVGDGEFFMPGFNIPKGERFIILCCRWKGNDTRVATEMMKIFLTPRNVHS